jgi:hypothetical protein
MSSARSIIVQIGGSGTEDWPCPRWSCKRRLYPFEVRLGDTRDQTEVFVTRELEKASQGASGETVSVTA